jgi:P-type conjugative transfer protein TrbJ
MLNRRHLFRNATLTLAAAALRVTLPSPSRADVPVIDGAGIVQLAAEWALVLQQLDATKNQVDSLRAAALQLDPRSYQSVQNLLAGNEVNFAALTRDLQSLGYTVEHVNARFRQLFPDEAAVRTMTPRQAETASRDMNQEIYASALVAARAQSTLRTIEDNNAEARNILSRSEGSSSQVAQLQSALQMLALIHQNLVSITQTVSASGRVASNQSVRRVTERRIQRERAARAQRDYARSEPVPEVDSRFLDGSGSW